MPVFGVDKRRIESIQKQFLLFCLRSLHWNHPFILPSYRSRLNLIHLLPLEDRHCISNCLFVFDILNNNIKSEELQQCFSRKNVSYSLRDIRQIAETTFSTTYGQNEPINRCIRMFNDHYFLYDTNKIRYKNALVNYFSRMASSS